MKIKTVLFILIVLFCIGLSAVIQGNMIGGEPQKSWRDGGQDFFVMFNSNIDNNVTLFGEDLLNPKGDTCVDSSVFTLNDFHIPEDTIIEKAYLVWMGAVDPSKLGSPTDNTVMFKFQQAGEDPITNEQEIIGADDGAGNGKLLTDEASFEFEALKFTDEVEVGCSETAKGSIEQAELGYFTYRTDITDFFRKIAEDNAAAEKPEDKMFYGDYTFSGLDCTEHDNYRCKNTMVSAWAVFFVYRSKNIRPRQIYLYNGLAFVQGDKSIVDVSGFELPKYPVVRLTTMIAGGDIELVESNFPPEGIFLQGQGATSLFRIYNDCNPMQGDGAEVFNSISSVVNWDPEAEETNKTQCVSGPKDANVNYGIDVDTFLLNSEENINLQEHLRKGNTSMDITLSVNQDAIFTNFMVISTQNMNFSASFDIPIEASDTSKSKWNFPLDREKHFCACPSNDEGRVEDYYCEEVAGFREFYYMIKIQNWGDRDADDVVVLDDLDEFLDYVPGTTEFATYYFAQSDKYDDWKLIPDKDGGAFPLSGDGYKIASKMRSCDQDNWTCADTIMVRYKVKPKQGTLKTNVIENVASISDNASEFPYKTNRSYPLKLSPTTCVSDTQCSSPTREMCGGDFNPCSCYTDSDCPEGYVCDCHCVETPVNGCVNANAEFELGKNSPSSEGGRIVIPKDNDGEPLTVGQFTLRVKNCEETEYFNFDAVTFHVDIKNNTDIKFSDMELIHDIDGNGVVDAEDKVISTGSLTTNYVKFYIPPDEESSGALKKFPGSTLNYFIVRTMVDYTAEEIPQETTFNFYIKSEKSIEISSQGTATVSPGEIQFATFMLEPTGDFFIVTIGSNDPPVPLLQEMNNDIPVLQLRTKAVEKVNSIKKFTVKIPVDSDYVKFGERNGISAISLYLDTNKDGVGDIKVAEKTSFDTVSTQIVFEDFIQTVSYLEGEEKYIVMNVRFRMVDANPLMAGKIEVPVNGIDLSDPDTRIVDLPIRSKTFTYGDERFNHDDSDDDNSDNDVISDGCGCSVIDVTSGL